MIQKNVLKNYLGFFHSPQQTRGKQLFLDGAVMDVNIDEEKKLVTARVQGGRIYFVSFKYLSNSQVKSGICTCPYRSFCKHQVALIEYLLNNYHPISKPSFQLTGHTGEFRLLQVHDLNAIEELVWKSSPYNPSYAREPYVGELVNQHTIHCFKLPFNYFQHESSPAHIKGGPDVEIDLTQTAPALKCNVCNKMSSNLCAHALEALQSLLLQDPFHDYYENTNSYEKLIADFSLQMEISSTFLSKYCRIFFFRQSIELIKKDDRIFLGDEKNNFISSLDELTYTSSAMNSFYLTKKKNEFEDHLGNALAWSQEWKRGQFFFPMIIEGKLNRDRTKLSSHIKEVHTFEYSKTDQINFYYEYEKLVGTNQHQDFKALLARIYAFLDLHLTEFSSFLHYFHQKEDNWRYKNDHKLMKKDLTPFSFAQEKADLLFEILEGVDYYELKVMLEIGSKSLPLNEIKFCHCLFLLIGNRAYLYKNTDVFSYLQEHRAHADVIFDKNNTEEFAVILFKLSGRFNIKALPEALKIETPPMLNGSKMLLIKESGHTLSFEPILHYEEYGEVNVLSPYFNILHSDNGMLGLIPSEQEVLDFINLIDACHPSFKESREGYEFYYLTIEEAVKNNWFIQFFEKCQEHNILVHGEDLFQNFKFNKNRGVVSSSVSSGIDWFDLHIEMSFGDQKVSTAKWVKALRNKEKYVQLDDGTVGIIPEKWLARLQKMVQLSDIRGNNLKISKLSFNVTEELFSELDEEELVAEIRLKKERLESFQRIHSHKIPRTVKAQLRDYQIKGYQWLKFLDEFQFGGCLADDMGLGKTLQVLSFLADQKKQKKGVSLVVVPRSLLFNWSAEIEKFCPSLSYLIYHGPNRLFETNSISKKDLIISTYDTITLDIEKVSEYTFNYCILDESQAIKNPNSKRYKAMRLLHANNRLVMTGTPIENNTFDLYGQFSFINPGLLGGSTTFKNKFAIPIDKRNELDAAEHLRKLIFPFLLRRTKDQVAKDLPEKTESILFCEMGPQQRKLYNELKISIRSDLETAIDADGINKTRFKILEGLLRLRQMCNSPMLLNAHLNPGNAPSAKLDILLEHLEEVVLNHKALVFSQFVSMLQLIRQKLEEKNINYAYLDGSTKDRQASVNEFQHNGHCKVFLVSLKAGNTGLNLTSAEYVYLFDPWWNPAVEAQAIDRTHRIGQHNKVFAYKLICKDTIEEKIIKLQNKKKKVAADIIRTDEHILKSLDKDKLMALFD